MYDSSIRDPQDQERFSAHIVVVYILTCQFCIAVSKFDSLNYLQFLLSG